MTEEVKSSGVLSVTYARPVRVRIKPDDGSGFMRWHDGTRTGQVGLAIEDSYRRVTVQFEDGARLIFTHECVEVLPENADELASGIGFGK